MSKHTDPPESQRWALYRSTLGRYMDRWIFRHPWGNARIHHLMRSDDDRGLHDHPWNFTSLIIRGGYLEHLPGCRCVGVFGNAYKLTAVVGAVTASPCRYYGPGSVIRHKAIDLHRLELLPSVEAAGGTWTFVKTGPRVRDWGFVVDGKWISAKVYGARD